MLKKNVIIISSLIILLTTFFLIKPSYKSFWEQNSKVENDGYVGYLIIEKINMNLGFYEIDDSRNNVNENIQVLSNSKKGSLFIAAHSGVGKVAYFNDLARLKLNDILKIKYFHNEYDYLVTDIYLELKDGDINVVKDKDESILILTTCSQIKKGYQLVIKAVLIEE